MNTAIIFGGRSSEHDASLSSATNVLRQCDGSSVGISKSIYIDRHGGYHLDRQPSVKAEAQLRQLPVISTSCLVDELSEPTWTLNLLHGQDGEDGAAAGLAKMLDLRGSWGSPLGDALGMAKQASGPMVASTARGRVRTPATCLVRSTEQAIDLPPAAWLNGPIVLKPGGSGASIKTFVAERWSLDCVPLVQEILDLAPVAMIQERIFGSEYSVGVIEVEGEPHALPVVRLLPQVDDFFSHDSKHLAGAVSKVFEDDSTTRNLQQLAESLFIELDGFGMTRTDFIVPAQGPPVFLETNTLPGLMSGSIFPKMLQRAGFSLSGLIELLQAADARRRASQRCVLFPYHIDEE